MRGDWSLLADEFGRIGASVGEVGASAKNHSERLEPNIFGKMGPLDSERLEYPGKFSWAHVRQVICCVSER